MVDRKKVIKGLKCISNGAKQPCRDCEYSKREEWCIAECAKDALALLKEQNPVEPMPTEDDDWICGACNNNSVVGTEELDEGGFTLIRFNYCPNCGQAVKWND